MHALPQVSGTPHRRMFVRSRASESALSGNDDVIIGKQRLADENLSDERAVGVACVDEVNSELNCPPQQSAGCTRIRRITPFPGPGDELSAKSETADSDEVIDTGPKVMVPESASGSEAMIGSTHIVIFGQRDEVPK